MGSVRALSAPVQRQQVPAERPTRGRQGLFLRKPGRARGGR